MRNTAAAVTCLGMALTAVTAHASGPTDFYYLASGTQLWRLQGNNDQNVATNTGNEYNIAVAGDIRTTSQRSSTPGAQYDLNGVYTGTNYPGNWLGFFDGTTDGKSNYSVDWDTGDVWQFDRNWANGSVLFTLPGGSGGYLGITYDPSNNSLWVSGWNSGVIENRAMNGTILSSFATTFSDITCLGMEYSTGTLWMGTQTAEGNFYNYSTNGGFLGSVSYNDMTAVNTLGGEFNIVPEPCTLALFAIGAGSALLRGRRRR